MKIPHLRHSWAAATTGAGHACLRCTRCGKIAPVPAKFDDRARYAVDKGVGVDSPYGGGG